ncbi:MAG TPA: hypothetical protein DDW49_11020 [Deltaproteobacteria bacterium]|nr:MAG: hypothetical protein A2048_01975 [Deltaproteobacteria bacterium GWA2_45_12]HBF13896.1 hypothetical protein [Deltaproteobacteria bacterium]
MNYIIDTHVLIWRFVEPSRLSQKQKIIFKKETNQFLVPSMSLLEVQYLTEIGRVKLEMGDFLIALKNQDNFSIASFDEGILLHSLKLTSNRDPFDRVILAHALATSTKILTRDRWMKETAAHLVID